MASHLGVQLLGVGVILAWSGAATLVILFIVARVYGMGADAETLEEGLGLSHHDERACSP